MRLSLLGPSLLGLALLTAACGQSTPAPQEAELRQTPAPDPAWTMHSITLYLPAPIIEQRASAQVLGDYIWDLRARALSEFSKPSAQEGVSGAVVVMVKPGRQARVWLATGAPMEPEIQAAIERALAEIAPPEVADGPVVFGLLFSAWGGGAPPDGLPMPIPEAWRVVSGHEGGRVMDDGYYEEVWALR
ncbi:hypothetical protein D3C72_1476680 [compost metagenome]